jgi:murein DD-endopeptidase MepM/ murein hydrolase activator NlpD
MLAASSLVVSGLPTALASAAPTVATDQQSIAQLEKKIAAEGAKAESLVLRYNQTQARVDAVDALITQHKRLLAADQQTQAKDMDAIQQSAVQAYVSDGGADATLAMFSGKWSVGKMLERNTYLARVNTKLDNLVSTLRDDERITRDAQAVLQSEEEQAKQTLAELAAAHDAATQAIADDEAQLSSVQGNVRVLLAAANAQREADRAAAEHALAAAARTPATEAPTTSVPLTVAAPASPPPPAPPSPSPPPPPTGSSNGYGNPLRAASALTPERIDQGVDYSGFGSVYAIGNGVVRNTFGSGWPGGTFIAYQLTDGPANGLVVYVAEDIQPNVQVGQSVSSGTVIGQMYGGPHGIETGWADPTSLPDTMARAYGQYDGSDPTAFGVNFSQFLQSVGAPGGIEEGPVSGNLPAGWPRW